jgi:hypothetical protein
MWVATLVREQAPRARCLGRAGHSEDYRAAQRLLRASGLDTFWSPLTPPGEHFRMSLGGLSARA